MTLRMCFISRGQKKPEDVDIVFEKDDWNDYGWKTKYRAFLPRDGYHFRVGSIKISSAVDGQSPGSTDIVGVVEALEPGYFSLGQSESFFKGLYAVDVIFARSVLTALKEVSYDVDLYEQYKDTAVFEASFLRGKSESDLVQFRRLAANDLRKISYNFTYSVSREGPDYELSFAVNPDANHANNLHAIIGSNGVGKTSLFKDLVRIISRGDSASGGSVEFKSEDVQGVSDEKDINKIVFASFSIFDQEEVAREIFAAKRVRAEFIGLLEDPSQNDSSIIEADTASSDDEIRLLDRRGLLRVLSGSLKECLSPAHRERLRAAISELSVDPVFESLDIESIFSTADFDQEIDRIFSACSSGHAICLLLTARLIELVEERTLVLFDEPESHLHPPLLSALMSVVRSVLEDRNAIGILATHSPVVLQELPKSRVWLLTRFGDEVEAYRPDIETLGENVGVLTREVFELQLRRTGYNSIIRKMHENGKSKQEILTFFQGSLGSEARALINTLY